MTRRIKTSASPNSRSRRSSEAPGSDRTQNQSRSKQTRKTRPNQRRTSKRRPQNPTAQDDSLTSFDGSERLQKILAAAGLGSRRGLEKRIEAGEIEVNGKTATIGATVSLGDKIAIDGRAWEVSASDTTHRTLIYHKPEGEVTTRSDPEGRKTVFDRLPRLKGQRWIAIGRLDINTAGLLLLTTDGELANQMMHPSGQVDREYLCRIRGAVSEEQIEQLRKGVMLEDGPGRFSDVVAGEVTGGHAWFTVAILEGRNREVRRLWEAVGAQVARLKRVRFGPVFLPARVRSGRYEELSAEDHRILREDVGLKAQARELVLIPIHRGHSSRSSSSNQR